MPGEVAFHTGVADPLGHACRLLRKAHAKGARVVVSGPAELLDRLDPLLWTFESASFVPHARLRRGTTPPERLARTPIWLVDREAPPPHREVLVNLGPERVPGCESFARVIEIVARSPEERDAGRRRWRQHEQGGARITHHPQEAA